MNYNNNDFDLDALISGFGQNKSKYLVLGAILGLIILVLNTVFQVG